MYYARLAGEFPKNFPFQRVLHEPQVTNSLQAATSLHVYTYVVCSPRIDPSFWIYSYHKAILSFKYVLRVVFPEIESIQGFLHHAMGDFWT
jgi:hypothetical protein